MKTTLTIHGDNDYKNKTILKNMHKEIEEVCFNNVKNISYIQKTTSKCVKLNTLTIKNTNLKNDLSFLNNLEKLKGLNLHNVKLTNFDNAHVLKNLVTLDLKNNDIKDLSFLNEKNQLYFLSLLGNNNLDDFEIKKQILSLEITLNKKNQKILNYIFEGNFVWLVIEGYLSMENLDKIIKTKNSYFRYNTKDLFFSNIGYYYKNKKITEKIFHKLLQKTNN